MTRVYRKTGVQGKAHVPIALADAMRASNQIDQCVIPVSRQGRQARSPLHRVLLPLYCLQYRRSVGGPAKYFYTVIKNFPPPPPDVIWEEIPRGSLAYRAQELLVDNREPTIGWASFFDTQTFIHAEATLPLRTHPDHHTNSVGRPVRTRVVHARRTQVPATLLALFYSIPVALLPPQVQNNDAVRGHLKDWFVAWHDEHRQALLERNGVLCGDAEMEMME